MHTKGGTLVFVQNPEFYRFVDFDNLQQYMYNVIGIVPPQN